jgi:putative transposase
MSVKVEFFGLGDFIHGYNRGNNKQPIFSSKTDYWRFSRGLRFFNDERDITELANDLTFLIASQKENLRKMEPRDPFDGRNTFEWREEWGAQRPLVKIIAYCLMPNHYHLILKEIVSGGISKFMKKLGAGYTVYWNLKNKRVGRIFQGQYRGKTIKGEMYLQYLDVYVQVINVFELFPGGIPAAMENFDEAFQFALDYPFCSLGESFGLRNLDIIDRDCLSDVFPNVEIYKEFCKDAIITHAAKKTLGKLAME